MQQLLGSQNILLYKFIPQFSEGITEVAWIDSDDINDKLTNSFENIKDLLKNNLSLIFKK